MAVQLQRDGLAVTQSQHFDGDLRLKADVVIVGSGAGGAVAAYELAKAGKSVIVLEAGPYVKSSEFNEKLGEMMSLLYQDQGAQPSWPYGDLVVGQGACVGGSTVVNATISFRFRDDTYTEWAEEHGLNNITKEALAPIFDEIEENLGVHVNEKHEINDCAQKVIDGCDKLGYSWKPVARNVKQCAITGHCLAGCPSDRKMSMLVTYLPWAAAHGAKIFSDAWVSTVKYSKEGRATGVSAIIRDAQSKRDLGKLDIDADVVILAAGAIQTPLIMQRSKIKNGSIGDNFSAHPFVSVLGKFKEPIYGWRGALTGVYIDHYEEKEKYMFESGLAEPEQLIATNSLAAGDVEDAGEDHLNFMREYKYMSAMNCFVHDKGHGKIRWDGKETEGNKKIHWRQTKEDFNNLKEAVRIAGKVYFAAGAEKVYLPTFKTLVAHSQEELEEMLDKKVKYGMPNGIPDGLYTFRTVSVHPQGTARMGANPKKSVVNPYGESHDIKGLFVTDASIFPSEITVNPQTPIYAMSAYIARNIVANQKDYFTD